MQMAASVLPCCTSVRSSAARDRTKLSLVSARFASFGTVVLTDACRNF